MSDRSAEKGETLPEERLAFSYFDPGCKKVFKAQSHYEALLKAEIERVIAKEKATGFSKTKAASRLLFRGNRLLECRVNVGALPAVRVAFALTEGTAVIVFLSTDIQKSEFSKALDHFLAS